ncbi:hypothetical protein AVEN_54749-1 [Araneus ventricosus]|uniref:DDE-1 domain-containing protein n=1 Tax=Araneus ventricosus TaxID=182803 RepID=A0A4Y2LBQ4_ARAVE|nr:hypothetical protein AVEN_54749-1 [Araneus ventricosus]
MFIFPQKRENTIHIDGASPGSFAQYHPSGRMQREILVYWFQTFIQFSKTSNGKPVLLIFGLPCHPYEEPRSDQLCQRKKCHFIVLAATLFPQDAAARHDLHDFFEHLLPTRGKSVARNASWKGCHYSASCQTVRCCFP